MRPFFILAPLGMLYLAIFGRVVQLHASPDPDVIGVSGELHSTTRLTAMRGAIFDRNGKPLAYDRPVYQLYLDLAWSQRRYHPANRPDDLTNDAVADEIATLAMRCQVPVEKMANALLSETVVHTVLRRNVDMFEAQALQGYLRNYRGSGLRLRPSLARVYPLGRTYGNLLGIVDGEADQRKGVSGLEHKLNDHLRGTAGSKGSQMVTGAFGVNPAKGLVQPESGTALWTSLDADLGPAARDVLVRSMEVTNAEWCGAVVMDVQSGEILALTSLPDFDPRDPWVDPKTKLDNSGERSSFAQAMENAIVPGSTFKPFVVGYALDQGIINQSEIFADTGGIQIPGRGLVKNARLVKTGPKTAEECLIHSSNVVSIRIGQRIGVERFPAMMDHFGLWDPVVMGQRTSPRGQRISAKEWGHRKAKNWPLVSASFGHQFMVNPVRYAASFCSLINGGHRVEPHYLVAGLDSTAELDAERQPKIVGSERPIRESTSDFLVTAMEKMVERRLGNPLPRIEGVRWGGKSGTARHETKPDLNTCTFAAFGPIPDPQILVFVVVQWPQVEGKISGTKYAGPVAGEILQHALRTRGLLPNTGASRLDSGSSNANLNPRLKEVR